MTLLTKEDLTTLAERRPGWHVSFFPPMHRAGVATLQNPVRCKNLLRQAEEHLLAHGLRPASAQELLAPVQRLLANYDFWQHQSEELALFVAPEVFRHYRLPLTFEELVVVTQRFHLKRVALPRPLEQPPSVSARGPACAGSSTARGGS